MDKEACVLRPQNEEMEKKKKLKTSNQVSLMNY